MGTAASSARRKPYALVADRRPDGVLRPLCRPHGSRRHWDGGFGQDPAGAGLPARVAKAKADPVGEPRGHLEVFVARELLFQALRGLGRAVVLQAEDDPVAGGASLGAGVR
jgi:hypothetical protein